MTQHTPPDATVGEEAETESSESRISRISWKMLVVSGLMGVIIGGIAGWATLNLGIGSVAFFVVFLGATYYLYQKPIPSAAIGSGLYATALLLVLTPILFYLPMVFGAEEGTAAGAGEFIGSLLGLLIWGFVFFLVALVVFVVGYFINKRANKKLEATG